MKRKHRSIELIKSLLILLLSCSAVLMAWKTGLFSDVLENRQEGISIENEPFTASGYYAAAYPKAAAVTWKSGMRFGISYDSEVMKKLLSSFSLLLEETYGTISDVESITEAEWRHRLDKMGLYLEYGSPFAPSVLASWAGTRTRLSDDYKIRRLTLSLGKDSTVLFSFQASDGGYYSCDTFTLEKTLEAAVQKWLPNGAEFACQIESLGQCSPYLLIADSELAYFTIDKTEVNWEAAVNEMFDIVGLKPDSAGSYEEQGERVYLCEGGQLRLSKPECLAVYTVLGAETPVKAVELPDKVEAARQILSRLSTASGGEAETEMIFCMEREDITELSFSYRIDGVSVIHTENKVSTVRFEGNNLTEICFFAQSYQKSGEAEGILPELQAAAAAGSISAGSVPELVFLDNGAARLSPVWIIKNGET